MVVGVGGMAVGGSRVLVGRGDGVMAIFCAVQPVVKTKRILRQVNKMLLMFVCCIVIIHLRLLRAYPTGY